MTGCGRAQADNGAWQVTAELRAVNHRFLDLSCRLPGHLSFLEETVRKTVGAALRRGHVEVSLTVRRVGGGAVYAQVDADLARTLAQAAEALQRENHLSVPLTVGELMRMEGVMQLREPELSPEEITPLAEEALGAAVEALAAMRVREGRAMRDDLLGYLIHAEGLWAEIARLAPTVVDEYRERLSQRLQKLPIEPVEPQRLAQEVALMADRCAVDEELARLKTHMNQLRAWLTEDEAGEAGVAEEIGKKMDFLIQEMNRETNTIGSKANHAGIAMAVVQLKSDIEKLREQAQNME